MTHHKVEKVLLDLCRVLHEAGLNQSNIITELVQLLLLKIGYERDVEHPRAESHATCIWPKLVELNIESILPYYQSQLLLLSQSSESMPVVSSLYVGAQTYIREPAHLAILIEVIDRYHWFSECKSDFSDAYERLLDKFAKESKQSQGQYFTPRPVIASMIRCIQPKMDEKIYDPAVGTGGFLIEAYHYIQQQSTIIDSAQITRNLSGIEISADTRRVGLTNCLLHGLPIKHDIIRLGNTLGDTGKSAPKADIILANPPFGSINASELVLMRDDFEISTASKQLAFVQHSYQQLKLDGRAAIVLSDHALFSSAGKVVRQHWMSCCQIHTILRLPQGVFFSRDIDTNIIFFSKNKASKLSNKTQKTEAIWVYDLRTYMPKFSKTKVLDERYLSIFEKLYSAERRCEGDWSFLPEGLNTTLDNSRWRVFSRQYIREELNDSLDIRWIVEEAADYGNPQALLQQTMRELHGIMNECQELEKMLEIESA